MSAATKEKKVSDKDVDLSNRGRDVWLVKVPKFIADRWESSASGTNVGTIQILSKGAGGGPDVRFKLTEAVAKERTPSNDKDKEAKSSFHVWSTTDQQIPSDYKLDFLKPKVLATQHLAVLSQTLVPAAPGTAGPAANGGEGAGEDGGDVPAFSKKLSVEGRVSCRAECKTVQSINSELYMRVKREALLKPTQTARKVQKITKLVKSYKPVGVLEIL